MNRDLSFRAERVPDPRRLAVLGWTAGVVVAAVVYAHGAIAASCGPKRDFLVRNDPLMSAVRPVDCSHVYEPAAAFAWPSHNAADAYVITLTFPDGHEETRRTANNWFAWDAPLPAGTYSWRLAAAGRRDEVSDARFFTVEG